MALSVRIGWCELVFQPGTWLSSFSAKFFGPLCRLVLCCLFTKVPVFCIFFLDSELSSNPQKTPTKVFGIAVFSTPFSYGSLPSPFSSPACTTFCLGLSLQETKGKQTGETPDELCTCPPMWLYTQCNCNLCQTTIFQRKPKTNSHHRRFFSGQSHSTTCFETFVQLCSGAPVRNQPMNTVNWTVDVLLPTPPCLCTGVSETDELDWY